MLYAASSGSTCSAFVRDFRAYINRQVLAVCGGLLADLHGCEEEGGSCEHESEDPQHYAQHFVVPDVAVQRVVCNTLRVGRAGQVVAGGTGTCRLGRRDVGRRGVHHYLKHSCSAALESRTCAQIGEGNQK